MTRAECKLVWIQLHRSAIAVIVDVEGAEAAAGAMSGVGHEVCLPGVVRRLRDLQRRGCDQVADACRDMEE